MAPVDDALDRLYVMADRAAGKDVRAADLAAITTISKELERLREELLFTARRPDDQEKIDAWWRARSEVKVDGNSRAEYVLQRDAAWERVESAEAEVRQLREGLREIENASVAQGYERYEEDVVGAWVVDKARALLAGSEAEPDGGGEA